MAGDTKLAIGAGFAQGAANFMQAYQQGQQRQADGARQQQELEMKRQLYALQMQKLQKEIAPVEVNMLKVSAARNYFGEESPFYKKAVNDVLDSVETPAQAQYLNKKVSELQVAKAYQSQYGGPSLSSGGQQDSSPSPGFNYSEPSPQPPSREQAYQKIMGQSPVLNKEEAAMYGRLVSNDSANAYKQGMLGVRNKEIEDKFAAKQREQDQKDTELNQKSQKMEYENKLNAQKLELETQIKTGQLSLNEALAKIREYEALNNAQTRGKLANTDEEYKREMVKIGRERNAIDRAKTGRTSIHDDPANKAANTSIDNDFKMLAKITGGNPGMMDMPGAQDAKAAKVRAALDQKLDAYIRRTGQRSPLDDRQPPARVSAQPSGSGYFGDNRVGPVAPVAPVAPSGPVRMIAPNGISGMADPSKVQDLLSKGYKVAP